MTVNPKGYMEFVILGAPRILGFQRSGTFARTVVRLSIALAMEGIMVKQTVRSLLLWLPRLLLFFPFVLLLLLLLIVRQQDPLVLHLLR